MPSPFAALEARTNAVALSMLANVEATLDGVPIMLVLSAGFEGASYDAYGKAGSSPEALASEADVPANAEGKELLIATGQAAGRYRIANIRRDGTGLVALQLLTQAP